MRKKLLYVLFAVSFLIFVAVSFKMYAKDSSEPADQKISGKIDPQNRPFKIVARGPVKPVGPLAAAAQADAGGAGAQAGAGQPLAQGGIASFENVKLVLDNSLRMMDYAYLTHNTISMGPGEPEVVSFIYQSKESPLASFEELTAVIEKGHAKREEGGRLFAEAKAAQNATLMAKAAQMLVSGDRDIAQENRFYTIETGTSLTQPPVLVVHSGLPDWANHYAKAVDLAGEYIAKPARITRIVKKNILEHMFVVENDKQETVFVDPAQGKVYRHAEVVEERAQDDGLADLERQERIEAQWAGFVRHGISIEQDFSLADLEDLSRKK